MSEPSFKPGDIVCLDLGLSGPKGPFVVVEGPQMKRVSPLSGHAVRVVNLFRLAGRLSGYRDSLVEHVYPVSHMIQHRSGRVEVAMNDLNDLLQDIRILENMV